MEKQLSLRRVCPSVTRQIRIAGDRPVRACGRAGEHGAPGDQRGRPDVVKLQWHVPGQQPGILLQGPDPSLAIVGTVGRRRAQSLADRTTVGARGDRGDQVVDDRDGIAVVVVGIHLAIGTGGTRRAYLPGDPLKVSEGARVRSARTSGWWQAPGPSVVNADGSNARHLQCIQRKSRPRSAKPRRRSPRPGPTWSAPRESCAR